MLMGKWIIVLGVLAFPVFGEVTHRELRTPISLPTPPLPFEKVLPIKASRQLASRPQRKIRMLNALNKSSDASYYNLTFVYRFKENADQKNAALNSVRVLTLREFQTNKPELVVHYWSGEYDRISMPPGFYLFRKGNSPGLGKPVLFGERLAGQELGLAGGQWTFLSPWSGKLKKI
jgi:hypothetical protein